jgi:hypothetical protein
MTVPARRARRIAGERDADIIGAEECAKGLDHRAAVTRVCRWLLGEVVPIVTNVAMTAKNVRFICMSQSVSENADDPDVFVPCRDKACRCERASQIAQRSSAPDTPEVWAHACSRSRTKRAHAVAMGTVYHDLLLEKGSPHVRKVVVPDVSCWTEGPSRQPQRRRQGSRHPAR